MNEIGIRQGRLSSANGSIPRFPSSSWQDEFARAKVCGFDSIEWLLTAADDGRNPVWTDAGGDEILEHVAATGVRVGSLCADYFITRPFVRVADTLRRESITTLSRLIVRAARVGVRVVVVPVLEAAEIRTPAEMSQLRDSLDEPLAVADASGIRLALETDLPAPDCRALVESRPHAALGLCYDIGNGAAHGYDVVSDLQTLKSRLYVVHIKDRQRNGARVPLGQGDADFGRFFRVASEIRYQGPLILEAPAGDDPVGVATAHLTFLRAQAARAEAERASERL